MTSPTQSDKTVEPMSEDDYWRIVLNNFEKDGDLPYGDKQRLIKLNEFITARDAEREASIRIDERKNANMDTIKAGIPDGVPLATFYKLSSDRITELEAIKRKEEV